MSEQLSELFASVIAWASSLGAKNISALPGVWSSRTTEVNGIGPLDVRINGHDRTIDGVPPFNAFIGINNMFPGVIAIVGPAGGSIMMSGIPGENEDGLVAHFKAQPPPTPAAGGGEMKTEERKDG